MIKFLTTDVFRMSAHDFCVTKTQVVGVICVLQKHLCMVSVGVICVLCVTETPVYGECGCYTCVVCYRNTCVW